jgi:membrane peptidoglycan carboxypeptidase
MTPGQRRRIAVRLARTRKPSIARRLICAAGVVLGGVVLLAGSVAGSALSAGGFLAATYYRQTVPPGVAHIVALQKQPIGVTRFYDRTGQHLIAELYDPALGVSTPVALNRISPWLQEATIAVENASFYSDPGFSVKGIARAAYEDVRYGQVQGASTITQQLVRDSVLSANLSLQRKLTEILIAYGLTQQFPGRTGKATILDMYLNTIAYGNQCKGIEAAARFYFHTHAATLDLAQAALLAGLPQGPSFYDPVLHLARALQRQRVVLDSMVKAGAITPDQAQQARAAARHFHFVPRVLRPAWFVAPHWFSFVVQHLRSDLPGGTAQLYSGLTVTTTLDLSQYTTAQQLVRQQTSQLTAYGHHATDGAVVAIDPRTREITCLVGSADWSNPSFGQINMATTPRQTGSSFKPFTYVSAFAQGHVPAEVIVDQPVSYPDGAQVYAPTNYDLRYHGAVTLRFALANSFNVPAVELLSTVGIDNLLRTVADVGMPQLQAEQRASHPFGLSVALGAAEVPLLAMVNAYAVFASGGLYAPYTYVRGITDADGQPVTLRHQAPPRRVVAPQYAYEITSILSDAYARSFEFGLQNPLVLADRPAAVKTGTTNDWKDNLTIGYTPRLVTGVWVGNADDTPMVNVIGIDGAGPIWQQFMATALAGTPAQPFVVPPGIITATVSGYDGLLATSATSWRITDLFAAGQVPHRFDAGAYNPALADNLLGNMNIDGESAPLAAATGGGPVAPGAGGGYPGAGTYHTATMPGNNFCDGHYFRWRVDPVGGYWVTCEAG